MFFQVGCKGSKEGMNMNHCLGSYEPKNMGSKVCVIYFLHTHQKHWKDASFL